MGKLIASLHPLMLDRFIEMTASAEGIVGKAAVYRGVLHRRTGHDVEIELINENGKPLADVKYRIEFVEGETREGVADSQGRLIERNCPGGQFYLRLIA